MLLEKDLKKLLDRLSHDNFVEFSFGNSDLTFHAVDHASKIMLSTPVYFGGNFIPSSVRKCATQKHSFKNHTQINTSLSIDEDQFRISLRYLDDVENLNHHNFSEIIEEFSLIADKWRSILDENDKNDLVYVHTKS